MKKLITTIILILLAVSLCSVALYYWLGNRKMVVSEAIQAIPIDASFLLKINDYHRLTSTLSNDNLVWKTLKTINAVEFTDNVIAFIDTLSMRSGAFNSLISSGNIYVSGHTLGKDDLEFLVSVKIPDNISKSDILNLSKSYLRQGIDFKEYDYNNISIASISDTLNRVNLFYTYFQGLIVCSSSRILIESSVRQLESQVSLLNNSGFLAISKTAGSKIDANFYINYQRVPLTFRKYLNQYYKPRFFTLSDIANWGELDITVKEESISLSGFSLAADSTNSFLRIFSRQKPVQSKITSVIPSQTATFISLGITDLDLYLEDYRTYLDRKGKVLEYTSSLSKIKKELGADIHDLYRSFFSKEIALFFVPYDGTEIQNGWFVAARTNSPSQTKQTFKNILSSYAKSNNQKISNYITTLKIDKEKSAEILRLPIKGLNATLLGSLFSEVQDEYFTFIDDYIIFGASPDALSNIILSNIHNKQLQFDVSYLQYSELLTSESNYFFYLNPGRAEFVYQKLFTAEIASKTKDIHSTLNKIQGVALQLSGGRNMIFSSVSIKYSPSVYEDPQTNWETRLDSSFVMKPQLLINHYTKNREIVVQDLKNKFYLLNDVGRVLWSKQLPETIMGEIFQVDLFKNGKLQFLFNTENQIYAIDRNGYFVKGFPIKLKFKATSPVAVFDYEKNRDYRLIIPCSDKKIYIFNEQGKPVSGWSFGKTERFVYNQPQHFRIKGKDYIVFADQNRPYILDRKGDERVKLSRYFSKSQNSRFVFEEASKNHAERLVTTDSLGLIRFVYFNGKVEDFAVKAFSSKHFFDYYDIDSDGENDFVFLDGRQLYIFSQNKTIIFKYKFDKDVLPNVLSFNFGGANKKFGVVSSLSNEIYLLSGNGTLYDGFPLKGNTLFSIGHLTSNQTEFNLFVGSPSGTLMNYSIK
ncbi:MAG: hypothetical protein AB9846_05825 [Tenuifilaceae bacterium]